MDSSQLQAAHDKATRLLYDAYRFADAAIKSSDPACQNRFPPRENFLPAQFQKLADDEKAYQAVLEPVVHLFRCVHGVSDPPVAAMGLQAASWHDLAHSIAWRLIFPVFILAETAAVDWRETLLRLPIHHWQGELERWLDIEPFLDREKSAALAGRQPIGPSEDEWTAWLRPKEWQRLWGDGSSPMPESTWRSKLVTLRYQKSKVMPMYRFLVQSLKESGLDYKLPRQHSN